MITLHIILILYENRILSTEPFGLRKDAEARAVQLSSEWYKKEGIEAFGKYQLESFTEMQSYLHSDAYLDSGDGANICIEKIVLKDLP